jgi:hypothetical protein
MIRRFGLIPPSYGCDDGHIIKTIRRGRSALQVQSRRRGSSVLSRDTLCETFRRIEAKKDEGPPVGSPLVRHNV